MKHFLFAFAVLLSINSHGQLQVKQTSSSPEYTKIGEVKHFSAFVASLDFKVVNSDTVYFLAFNNMKYTRIDDLQSIAFEGTTGTLDALYGLMMTTFADENKKNKDYKVDVKLGNEDVTIGIYRTMGVTSCLVTSKKGFFWLSEKQVKKLFNRT